LNSLYFGGGCINDTLIHNATKNLPFGGVGASGIGAYHGAKSFDCFSHQKGIVKRGTWVDVPIRYRAYESKLNLVKRLFKYFS
jgi:aldehyde dehydrogenase (NAD+)